MALGLTSSGSIDDLRLVIEGKISELDHEPCNVQVLFEEHTSDTAFELWDESGGFLTVPSAAREPSPVEESHERTERESESSEVEPDELASLRESVAAITTERDALRNELEAVRQELDLKKARIKELWRMNCGQLSEYDSLIVSKDEEISRLTAQLAERCHQRASSDDDDNDAVSTSEPLQPREGRRGRAPPVDKFTGEDPSVRLDDWLPGRVGLHVGMVGAQRKS